MTGEPSLIPATSSDPKFSDADRSRIRQEEEFRAALRREFEEPRTRWARIVAFFNSAFGIWLLSTVGLGVLGHLYTSSRETRAAQLRMMQSVNRLDTEIMSRLRFVSDEWSMAPEPQLSAHRARLIVSLMRPDSAAFPTGVFPEFETRTLPSLIWELRSELIDSAHRMMDSTTRATLDSALAASARLSRVYAQATSRTPSQILADIPRRSAAVDTMVRVMMPLMDALGRELTLDLNKATALRHLNLERWHCPLGSQRAETPCVRATSRSVPDAR